MSAMTMAIRFAVSRWLRALAEWVAAPAVTARFRMKADAVARAVEPLWPDFLVTRETCPSDHIEHLGAYLMGVPEDDIDEVHGRVQGALFDLEDAGSVSHCMLYENQAPDSYWCDEILLRRGKAEVGS